MTDVKDISTRRGDTARHTFTVRDKSGSAVDISGWSSFVLTVTTEERPIDISGEIGSVAGAFVTDGADGMVYFSPLDTWSAGRYFYDAQAIDSNGEKRTFVEGVYDIVQDRSKG